MEAFEHEGLWWDPRNAEQEWIGTLRFEERSGATLTVIVPAPNANPFRTMETHGVILGITAEGIEITLISCHERFRSSTMGGGPCRTEIFANSVIVGVHAADPDPFASSISVTFEHLSEWRGHSGIAPDLTVKAPDMMVRYVAPPPLVVHDDGVWRVSLRSGLSGTMGRRQIAMREETTFNIEVVTPQRLSDFRRRIQACGDFLTIACLTFCHVEELAITFPGEDAEQDGRGTFHAIPIYKNRDRRSSSLVHMLLRFSDIAARARETFSPWFAAAETLDDVRALYLVGVYGDGFVETKLLALTQAVEAVHRRLYPGVYMDPNDFVTQVFEPMKAAVPAAVGASHRAAITSRLWFANQFSQSKRMEALFREHAETLRTLVPDPAAWIKPILDHRNAFTHFDPEVQPSAGSDRVLLFNWLLRLLLEACFLKVMGFTHEEIAAMARRSETYRQLAARFRRNAPSGSE